MDALNIRVINNHNQVIGTTDDAPGTPTVIGLLKETYNRLRTTTENTNNNITNLQGRISSIENVLDGSESTESPALGLVDRVEELENTVINHTLAIQNNTDNISLNQSNISTNQTNIQTLQGNVQTLQGNVQTLQGSINDTNTELTRVNNNLSQDLTTLTNRIALIDGENGRLSTVETTVSNLVDEVEGQNGALDDIITLQADVSTLQSNLGTLQTDLGTLETGLGTLETTVSNLPLGVGQKTNQTGGERFNLYESRNTASGDYSHAEGYLTQATGNYSHVEGSSNVAGGESSHAEGSLTTAAGISSHAEGTETSASGLYSHAEGALTTASGLYSHSEGFKSQAINIGAHAEGGAYNNSTNYGARGDYSHVEGYSCLTNASYAHAEGDYCKATNQSSHAEGHNSSAAGMYSHATGESTYADSRALTVVGRNNTWTSGIENQWVRLFVVGNGTSNSTRSEAFVVNDDGSVIINSTRSGTTPSLTIGPSSKAITSTTAASSSTEADDQIIATKYYIDSCLGAIAAPLISQFMNIFYPVGSIYLSHVRIYLTDGKPTNTSNSPLDYGTWIFVNQNWTNYYNLGLATVTDTSGTMYGFTKIEAKHLPPHGHKGIYTTDATRPTGTGGTAAITADTYSGSNKRTNYQAYIINSIGDCKQTDSTTYSYTDLTSIQNEFIPYGYYCFLYRKTSLI